MEGRRVLLAGDEAAGARTLTMLRRSPHEIVAVAAGPATRYRKGSLWDRAASAGITTIAGNRLKTPELGAELVELGVEVLLNVHSMYRVHPEVLDACSIGAWNLHPGPLPQSTGINVPSWAIFEGHTTHGVTVHAMTEHYDEGAIAYEDRFELPPDATGLSLSTECARRGMALIERLIDQLAVDPDGVPRRSQGRGPRRLYRPGEPNDGVVDWSAPAATISGHVRAADFRPFPGPWSTPVAKIGVDHHRLFEVTVECPTDEPPGHVVRDAQGLVVAAADRWVRVVESEVLS